MASWRVVCVKRWTVSHPERHSHIVGMGTGDRADWADMRWSLDQVLIAMDEGDTFFTQSEPTDQTVLIERYVCPVCKRLQLRSAAGYGQRNTLAGMIAVPCRRPERVQEVKNECA